MPGYGDFYAYGPEQELITTIAMFVGLWIYGYSLAVVAMTLANNDAPRVRFIERLLTAKAFMEATKLPKNLQKAVRTQTMHFKSTNVLL